MAAGVASIEFFVENQINNYVTKIGELMLKKLEKIEMISDIVGDVRGRGLMLGMEIVENKETKKPSDKLAAKVREECFKRGVLIEIGGHYNNVVRFLPPLIITKELVEIGVEIIKEAVINVEDERNKALQS